MVRSLHIFRRTLIPHTLKNIRDGRIFCGLDASHFHSVSSSDHHVFQRNREEDYEKRRLNGLPSVAHFHSSPPNDRMVAIILGLGAVSAGSYAAATAIRAYREWQSSLPEEPDEPVKEEVKAEQTSNTSDSRKESEKVSGERENVFAKWFGVGVGSKYYEGGFEEEMTRREAALILGVRESSSPARIKEAHRKLLILNHPDTGGSTYMSGKINEAKDLMLKGKRMSA